MKGHIRSRGKTSWEIKFDVPAEGGRRQTIYRTIRGTQEDAERALAKAIDGEQTSRMKRRRERPAGIGIYVIRRDERTSKVGITRRDVFERLRQIETATGEPLFLDFWLRTDRAIEIERRVLADLRKFRTVGEWIDLPSSEVIAAVMA
jgi:hypothetical protein